MHWIRQQGRGGLYRLCISASNFTHTFGGRMLRDAARDVFYDVENFALAIGRNARGEAPPDWWEEGTCALEEFPSDEHPGDDGYKALSEGIGHQFKDGDRWIVVGKREMRIVSLRFEHGR